jgi:Right handed beta helix region
VVSGMTSGCLCAVVAAGFGAGPTLVAARNPAPVVGNTDAAATIQRAVDGLPAAGGTVRLPAGTYVLATGSPTGSRFPAGQPIRSALVIRADHVRIQGSIGRTILQLAPGAKMRAITFLGKGDALAGIDVRGDRRHRASGAGWPGGDVVDALLYASGARDVAISHCDISGGLEDGIGAFGTHGITVQHSAVHDNGNGMAGAVGIALTDTTHALAADNIIDRNSAAGISIGQGSSSVRIDANHIEGNAKEGVVVSGTGVSVVSNDIEGNGADHYAAVSLHGAHATTVDANRVVGNRFVGIAVTNGPGGPASRIRLADNTVTGNGTSAADQVRVDPGQGATVSWGSTDTVPAGHPGLWPIGVPAGIGAGGAVYAWRRYRRSMSVR